MSTPKMMTAALVALGLILIAGQFLLNFGSYVKSAFQSVSYPQSFSSPAYERLLKQAVRDVRVDYRLIKRSGDLATALDEIARISPERIESLPEQVSFWINVYNLLMLKEISDAYPIPDVRKLANPKVYVVGGKAYSLSQVEVKELRPLISRYDPRAIFLKCGGSLGDPPLAGQPVSGGSLERQMGVAAYKFIHNRHNVYFDQTVDIFFLSRFFEWHQDVIETHFDSPFEFVNHYLEPGEQVDLENIRIQKRYFDTFNWALNDYGGGREADETR